jgi:TonB-linked SusC/RagA family outer membrane protein
MKSFKEINIMRNYKIKLLPVFIILMVAGLNSYAQNQKRASLHINSTLVNENDEPIKNALIVLGDGLVQTHSDEQGHFSLDADAKNIVLISANGYDDRVIKLAAEIVADRTVLKIAPLFEGDKNTIVLPANSKITQRALTGAVSKISGQELESQPDAVFHNALQGRLAGLVTRMNTNGLANNKPSLYVRGLGRDGGATAITVVDGIERGLEFLTAEEILSVEVLKDATAKILYGPRAANGVVLVTTKHGRKNTQVVKASVEYGVNMNTRMPEYLNSADYATLYNEALENDGLAPIYSAQDIAGYRASTGVNDQLYPNIDHNSYFIKDSSPFRKANFEYSGGTDDSQYGVYIGYVGTSGIEKVGENVNQDRFNVRGSLDFQITDNLVGHIVGNGIIESRNWGKLNQDQVFNRISSERPNEFPFVIMDPNFQGEAASLGDEVIPPLGGSFENKQSLYGDLVYGGYQEYQFFYGQTDFGLDWDLKNVVKGLSASTNIHFDNYQYHAADQINNPIRYATQKIEGQNGSDSLSYVKLQNRGIERNRTERSSNITRSLGWTTNIKYEKIFNKDNKLNLDLSYFYFLNQDNGRRQHIRNSNTTLKTNYAFKNKLYFELTFALMGSNKFASKNELMLSHAFGAGWVLSEEDFLANSNTIDFLKLKSSYGVLGYDGATDFYLYETRYSGWGNVNFGERNSSGAGRTHFNNFGNPNLQWERSEEFNVGIEGLAFDKSLQFELNYFTQNRDRIIYNSPSSIFSSINGSVDTPLNLGEVFNNGVDGSINWLKSFGDFKMNLGANFLFSKNKVKAADEVSNPDAYLNSVGMPSDVIFGYVSKGIFKTQQEVDNAPFQALGSYGVGNISYQDLNNDGIVDEQDRKVIGNSFPRTSLGFILDTKYKGFGLSMLGTSELGVDMVKNNPYFRNSGQGKYSVLAADRFHPVNNSGGTQPILTTLNPVNDNVTSSFWMESASFFRLKNVELSYTLSNDLRTVKTMRFYVRGTNLFVISNIKDLDPEVPNSGVTNYPLFRTITGGVTLGF